MSTSSDTNAWWDEILRGIPYFLKMEEEEFQRRAWIDELRLKWGIIGMESDRG
jgi:hypothetical protein